MKNLLIPFTANPYQLESFIKATNYETIFLSSEIEIIDGIIIDDSFPIFDELELPDIIIHDPFRLFDE